MPSFTNTVSGEVLRRPIITLTNITLSNKNITPMKSCFTNNTAYYKRGSLTSGVGTVRNNIVKMNKT